MKYDDSSYVRFFDSPSKSSSSMFSNLFIMKITYRYRLQQQRRQRRQCRAIVDVATVHFLAKLFPKLSNGDDRGNANQRAAQDLTCFAEWICDGTLCVEHKWMIDDEFAAMESSDEIIDDKTKIFQ